jgi:5-methylcytosine-specific restriction endonuclease McrA
MPKAPRNRLVPKCLLISQRTRLMGVVLATPRKRRWPFSTSWRLVTMELQLNAVIAKLRLLFTRDIPTPNTPAQFSRVSPIKPRHNPVHPIQPSNANLTTQTLTEIAPRQRKKPRRSSWSDDDLNYIYNKTGGYCNYCEKKIDWSNYGKPRRKGAWTVDHMRPVSRGGTDHMNNLVPACVPCNSSKGDLRPREF